MKKRLTSAVLSIVMVLSMLQIAAAAGTMANTSERDPILLGTEAEYSSALDTMFDDYGLRLVSVGYNSNDGLLNNKYGFINKYGNFVAAPIYDKIELMAAGYDMAENGRSTVVPQYFLGGYTQVVRDGKMGLLNTSGEEVVPCKYDFVRLPSDGVCAVFDSSGRLGYWNIEQNREIVAPKYKTYKGQLVYMNRQKPEGDYYCDNDFIQGYALVFHDDGLANIIDKNGREILSKSYPTTFERDTYELSWERYPQKGPYLAIYEVRDGSNLRFSWEPGGSKDKKLKYNDYLVTGLVGANGVIIQPSYNGIIVPDSTGLNGNALIMPAWFHIIPEKNLILTQKGDLTCMLEGGYGTVDLKGNVLIPFDTKESGQLQYNEAEGVITKPNGRGMWSLSGKVIHDLTYAHGFFYNGYDEVIRYTKPGSFQGDTVARYIGKPDGSLFNITAYRAKLGLTDNSFILSKASTSGYFWMKGPADKYGLIDFSGNVILPFEYDDVNMYSWDKTKDGYAIVTKAGKVGLVNAAGKLVADAVYDAVTQIYGSTFRVMKNRLVGLADLKKGGLVLPAIYDTVGKSTLTLYEKVNVDCFAMGVYYAKKGGEYMLLDAKGNTVFSTSTDFSEYGGGLYGSTAVGGLFDAKGQVIIPNELLREQNLEYSGSYTIYAKGGKVYRQSANYIDHSYGFKPYAPTKATAVPSSTKLVVNGKNVAVDAYNINGNNYIKLRDLAFMITGTDKNFEVSWDGSKNAVNLVNGKPYTSVGGEMAKGSGQNQSAVRTTSKIYVDGGEVSMTAYNIKGNNYFKLRDVMQVFDVNVGWDGTTGTATLTTATSYALAAYEQSKYDAQKKAYEAASGNQYVEKPIMQEEAIKFTDLPNETEFNVGSPFSSEGLRVVKVDIYGKSTDITDDIVLKVENTKLYDGYKFQVAGTKTVNCYYKGEKLNSFKITVYKAVTTAALPLEDGDYYLKLMDKYVVDVGATNKLELSDSKPENPFTVTHLSIDKENGYHIYKITVDGGNIKVSEDNMLTGNSAGVVKWRIAKYSDFWTIRLESDQAMAMNAKGSSAKAGTPVIVTKMTGSAPENAKIVFEKAGN